MKKHFSIPVLVLAAGLAGSFQPGSGYAREQSSPGSGPGQLVQPDVPPGNTGSAPQSDGGTGWEERDSMRQESEPLGAGPGVWLEQEQFGVAPETGEEPAGRSGFEPEEGREQEQTGTGSEEGLEQEQIGTGSGEGVEQEQFGVAPEAREGTPDQSGTRQQERFGTDPEQAGQEQFGVAPGFGENGEGQGWVGPDGEGRGSGWRRKSMPGAGR